MGGWLIQDGHFGGADAPTVGLFLSRDYTNTELILLDLSLTRLEGDYGAVGLKAGVNRYILPNFYLGGAAGGYISYGAAPLAEVVVGFADRSRSNLRLQLGLQAAGVDFCCSMGSATVGFTVR